MSEAREVRRPARVVRAETRALRDELKLHRAYLAAVQMDVLRTRAVLLAKRCRPTQTSAVQG